MCLQTEPVSTFVTAKAYGRKHMQEYPPQMWHVQPTDIYKTQNQPSQKNEHLEHINMIRTTKNDRNNLCKKCI